MERLCMRPGCDRSVVARLTYDTISCQVWLDAVRERPGPAQEICELHTARLTVPRGWMLCDRRDESPALFVPEPAVAAAAPPVPPAPVPAVTRPAPARRPAAIPESQQDLFGVTVNGGDPLESVELPEPVGRVERRIERRVAQTAPVVPAADGEPTPGGPIEAAPAASAPNGSVNGTAVNGDVGSGDVGNGDVGGDAAEPEDEDLPESLQATSPLLARAFRATGHQHSVLTQTLLNDPD